MMETCSICGERFLAHMDAPGGHPRVTCNAPKCRQRRHDLRTRHRRIVRYLARFLANDLPAERARVAKVARLLGVTP